MPTRIRITLLSPVIATASLIASADISANLLDPLPESQAESLFRRAPGCEARVAAGSTLVMAVASGAWVTYRTAEKAVEAPVLFQDAGKDGPEIQFGATAGRESQQGVLRAYDKTSQCANSRECKKVAGHLTIKQTRTDGSVFIVHDGEIEVTDSCGADRTSRLFRTTTWWEKLLRLIGRH